MFAMHIVPTFAWNVLDEAPGAEHTEESHKQEKVKEQSKDIEERMSRMW
jgi:hypothetical protein